MLSLRHESKNRIFKFAASKNRRDGLDSLNCLHGLPVSRDGGVMAHSPEHLEKRGGVGVMGRLQLQ